METTVWKDIELWMETDYKDQVILPHLIQDRQERV